MKKVYIKFGGGGGSHRSTLPFKTGQTIIYATGDDGDTQRGLDRYWLSENNPFGNLSRKTGSTGGYFDVDTLQYKSADGTVLGVNRAARLLAFPDRVVLDWGLRDSTHVKAFDLGEVTDTSSVWGGYTNGGTLDWNGMLSFGSSITKLGATWEMINLSELNESISYIKTECPIVTVMGQSTGGSFYTGCSTTIVSSGNIYGFDLGVCNYEQMSKTSPHPQYRFIYTAMIEISTLI